MNSSLDLMTGQNELKIRGRRNVLKSLVVSDRYDYPISYIMYH